MCVPDIQLSPSRTDDYIPKLYYETNRFTAFDQLWVIKAKVEGNETSYNRSLKYSLMLKGGIKDGVFHTNFWNALPYLK